MRHWRMVGVAAVVAVLALRNVAGDTTVPRGWYVPANLGVGALAVAIAADRGVSARELGLARNDVPRGLRLGGALALGVVAIVALAAALPGTRGFFEDQRVAGIDGPGELAYEALVRIPIGTALFEEVAFRGVLLALLARRLPVGAAVAASSVLFGLWHIRPTLSALETNDLAESGIEQAAAVAGAVVATTVAGVLFCVLRLRSGSLVAPVLVHATINASALTAAYLVLNPT